MTPPELTDEEAAAIKARAAAGKMLPREYLIDIGYLLADRRERIAREAALREALQAALTLLESEVIVDLWGAISTFACRLCGGTMRDEQRKGYTLGHRDDCRVADLRAQAAALGVVSRSP